MPNIQVLQQSSGAKKAQGLTVIIDVFRAFTTACMLISNGAKRIIPIASIDEAIQLIRMHEDYILIGERKGIKIQEAEFGNSPEEISRTDFTGKTIVLTTSAGTQGFVDAVNADQLLTGSLANAAAIIKYILKEKPTDVSLVCMGYRNQEPTDEDTLCAELIKTGLSGGNISQDKIVSRLKKAPSAQKFFDPDVSWAPEEDFFHCTKLNSFPFILKLHKDEDGIQSLFPIYVD